MNKLSIIGFGLVIVVCMCVGAWFFLSDTDTKLDTPVQSTDEQAAAITIIAFGDSLTAGYGVQLREAYPAQLERALRTQGYDVEVINSGVSGETTRGNQERAGFIRAQQPDVVLLGTGGNDALRSLPVENTQNNIAATIDILLEGEQAPKVLLLKMQAPLNSGKTYKQNFDAIYESVATQKNITLVPFLTEDIFFDESNKLPDGIHYNEQGYTAVTEAHLLPAVIEVLQERL
jgi:acyl-CoA thioesterase-1